MVTRMVVEAVHHTLNYTFLSAKSQVSSMFQRWNQHRKVPPWSRLRVDSDPKRPFGPQARFRWASGIFDSIPRQHLLQSPEIGLNAKSTLHQCSPLPSQISSQIRIDQ